MFGEFSAKFAEAARAAPHLGEPDIVRSEPGEHPPIGDAPPDVDVVALTHNETSTGVAMQLRRPGAATRWSSSTPPRRRVGCRGTPSEVDVYYFAPQKCFASDGGLWLAACSPAALERIRAINASGRWTPASLDLKIALDNSLANQTYNTPALATLVLLSEQLTWMLGNGGLAWCVDRCRTSANHLYDWAAASGYATPFVTDPAQRSAVVGTIDLGRNRAGRRRVRRVASERHRRHRELPQTRPQPAARRYVSRSETGRRRHAHRLHRLHRRGAGAMNVAEVLSTHLDGVAPLSRPIMVLALRGWFDIAEVATIALNELLADRVAPIVAAIDPDPFFDFTQERPQVEVDDDVHHIRWPTNEFRYARFPGAPHDLVVLSGVEPHLRYATFADSVLEVARLSKCEVVVTVGAVADAIPHTRPPVVVGSTTNHDLASALGLAPPRYQGITGLVGVLQERLDRAGTPAISLRVGVPHYLGNAQHPQSSIALMQHLHHVLGVPVHIDRLAAQAITRRVLHDEAVADDEQARAYVAMLEREYDQRAEEAIPSADDLAADFERFLRDQRDDG